MPRLLSSLLLAFALLLSPLAMIGGAGPAHAAAPQSAAGHCAETAPAPQREMPASGMEVGCAVACAAVPATAPFAAVRLQHDPLPPTLPVDQLPSGIHPEGETPPPRIRPEI